jgi:hypothetical protein
MNIGKTQNNITENKCHNDSKIMVIYSPCLLSLVHTQCAFVKYAPYIRFPSLFLSYLYHVLWYTHVMRPTKCTSVKFNLIFHYFFYKHRFRTLGLNFRKAVVTSTATLFHIQDCSYRCKPYFDEPGCNIHADIHYTVPVLVTTVFLKMSPRVNMYMWKTL